MRQKVGWAGWAAWCGAGKREDVEHSQVSSKERTSTRGNVREGGPEHLRGVRAATVLFKPPNCAEGNARNRIITVLYCSQDCVAEMVGGFFFVLIFHHLHIHHQAFQY